MQAGADWPRATLSVRNILILCLCLGCKAGAPRSETRIPMVRLLALPGSMDGQNVEVRGFASISFEHDALYPSESDFLNSMDGVWLKLSPALRAEALPLERHYVLVSGIFSAQRSGHMGAYLGEIEVERMSVLSNPRCPVEEIGHPAVECSVKP